MTNVLLKTNLNAKDTQSELEGITLYTSRVAKVVKGGKRMRFRALVVVGDRNGRVGLAFGKAKDIKTAIDKATKRAKSNLIEVKLNGTTIPYEVFHKYKAAKIFFKPAKSGTGIICSNSIRPIIELAGIKDIFVKIYGTSNKINNSYCTFEVLSMFKKE